MDITRGAEIGFFSRAIGGRQLVGILMKIIVGLVFFVPLVVPVQFSSTFFHGLVLEIIQDADFV